MTPTEVIQIASEVARATSRIDEIRHQIVGCAEELMETAGFDEDDRAIRDLLAAADGLADAAESARTGSDMIIAGA